MLGPISKALYKDIFSSRFTPIRLVQSKQPWAQQTISVLVDVPAASSEVSYDALVNKIKEIEGQETREPLVQPGCVQDQVKDEPDTEKAEQPPVDEAKQETVDQPLEGDPVDSGSHDAETSAIPEPQPELSGFPGNTSEDETLISNMMTILRKVEAGTEPIMDSKPDIPEVPGVSADPANDKPESGNADTGGGADLIVETREDREDEAEEPVSEPDQEPVSEPVQ